jgi:hypothetical protein
MNLQEMFHEVQITLDKGDAKLVKYGEFLAALMSTIRVINADTEKANEVILMSRRGGNPLVISEQLSHDIESDPYYIVSGNSFEDVLFDADENKITVPSSWIKIVSIFKEGTKLRPVSYDKLSRYGAEDEYYHANNSVWFNFDVMSDSLELLFVYRREYSMPKRSEGLGAYSGMPEYGYSLLMTGVILSLLSRPRFFDPNIYTIYRQRFDEAIYAFNSRNLSLQTNIHGTPRFTYSKEVL